MGRKTAEAFARPLIFWRKGQDGRADLIQERTGAKAHEVLRENVGIQFHSIRQSRRGLPTARRAHADPRVAHLLVVHHGIVERSRLSLFERMLEYSAPPW